MYAVTWEATPGLMTMKLSGKVSGKEYAEICKAIRGAVEKNPPVDLLCELDGFRGIGLTAMWRAALTATENSTNLRRVAVVGEPTRYKWARVLVRGFHAETRYFDQAHRTRAIRWLEKAARHGASSPAGGFIGDASYRDLTIQRQKTNQPKGRTK